MNRFTRLSGRLIWAITLLQASAATGETRVGWEADFRGSALGGAVEPHYVIRGSGGKTDDSRLILRNSDGTVTIGGKFDQDAAKRGDYVPLEWRDLNLSLLDYPILELRFRPSDRKVNLLVQCVYEFADGSRATPYFYAQFTEPGQWTTVAKRICPDGSLPKPWTPRSLVGFHIWAKSDREVTVDFDWVRLRGLNESERARQNEWVDLLKDYHPEEPPVLSEFFPFGVYDSSPDSSSLHKQTHRMSYRTLSKHHVNFVLATSGAVDAAGEMGIRVGLRMRQCSNRFEEGGTEGVIDWAKPTIERIKDDPTVLCYDVGDERPIAHLWSVAAGVRILQKLDPTRPSILTFWDPAAIRAYGPYVPVDVSDIYPLVPGGGRKPPHYHHEWCRRVARENGNKRQWMILQSFGNPPWRSRSGYLIPTVEQLRLQIWSSLAGGARGIICYSTSYDRYRMLTDQWGNPNELMEEVARIGERIIPLGRRLLDCTVDFESAIGCDNEDLLVGIVRSTARGVSYAIVVNKDLHAPQSGRLRGVRESLYDLDSLRKEGDLSIDAIRPGGGRIYLVGGDEQFETEAEAIQSNREQEAARAATPNRLFEQRGCDAQHRDTLDETARIMGAIEPAMYLDNPDATVVERMLPYRVRYWTIHARWVTAYEQLLAGRNAADAGTVLRYSRHLIAEVKTALGDHPMFPGSLRNEDTKDP